MWSVYLLATCLVYLTTAGAQDDRFYRRSDILNRLREAYFKRGEIEKRDCVELNEPCRSTLAWKPRCCGDTVCYWPNGISIIKDGYCVKCIEENQKCQLDTQCCKNLVCHRDLVIHADGKCGPKRGKNEPCHEDDNCLSGDCHLLASSLWTEGRCQ